MERAAAYFRCSTYLTLTRHLLHDLYVSPGAGLDGQELGSERVRILRQQVVDRYRRTDSDENRHKESIKFLM